MTSMHRVSLAIPEDLEQRIMEARKDDRFVRYNYSELLRRLLEHGLDIVAQEKQSS